MRCELKVSFTTPSSISTIYSRHQSSSNSLRNHRQESKEASQIRSQSCHNSRNADEESHNREEERNDVKGPRNSAGVVVAISQSSGTKVTGWVEWNRSALWSTVAIVAVDLTADGEVRPACWIGDVAAVEGAADVVGCGLEEVDFVFGGSA